jgi:hypothetical protein
MTVPSSTGDERGGAVRSPRTPRLLSVLVMSGDPRRRTDWARFFETQGMHAIRCAGPEVASCALETQRHCPLHDDADLIFYDEESVTRELERQLELYPVAVPIAYARSDRASDGSQYPVIGRVRWHRPPGSVTTSR